MLTDVIAAINADFAARVPPIPVACSIGPAGLSENNLYPRIVVLFTKDKFGPKNTVGPAGVNPASMRTRFAGAEIHVWGADYDTAALLAHQFIIALYRSARGVFALGEGRWNNDITIDYAGIEYIFAITVEIPIQETPWPLTPEGSSFEANAGARFLDGQVGGQIEIDIPIPDPT